MRPLLNAQGEQDQESVEVSAWGKHLRVDGPNAFPWLLIVVLLACLIYVGRFILTGWGEPFDAAKALTDHNAQISADHRAFRDSVDELTYVNAICLNPKLQQECADLKLTMPDSLRKKLRRD